MNAMSLLPIVSDISPDSGSRGDTITITGIFKTATGKSVTFGGIAATIVTESLTTIECTVPVTLTGSTPCDVVVTDPGADSCTSPNGFTLQAPVITDVSPNSSVAIGDTITVTGIFSASGNSGTIGGISATISYQDATTIQCVVPAGLLPNDVVDLVITNANGNTVTAPNTLRIVDSSVADILIRDVDEREWDSDGNESVLLEMVNASITGNSVSVGVTPVDIITESETQIKIRTPALAVGTYDLKVTAADSRSDTFVDCITVKDMDTYDPKFPEIYDVYRMAEITANGIGETIAPNVDNLEWVGSVHAMVNTGDSLEPDVRGTGKDVGQDVTSMWLGWFKITNFDIKTGDIIKSTTDPDRIFQIQYFDKYPGGKVPSHHWEARLQTTEIFRGNA